MDQLAINRIANLSYPEPSTDIDSRLSYTEHLNGINIATPWLAIYQSDDPSSPGSIVIRLRTRIANQFRSEVNTSIPLDFSATKSLQIQFNNWTEKTLTLTSNDTIQTLSTSNNMENAQWITFDIPTKFLIDAINANTLDISIVNSKYTLTDESVSVIREFAATLKPDYPAPTPNYPPSTFSHHTIECESSPLYSSYRYGCILCVCRTA